MLYNPIIVVNKKIKLNGQEVGIALNNVVREVSPRAFDSHTGDGSKSNQVIYPASNGIPARMTTYLKAGTFSNLTLCLKNLLNLIGQSGNPSLQIKAFILSYLKPNQDYNLKHFIKIVAKHFKTSIPVIDSNLNDLINQQILVVSSDNKLKLVKHPKSVDITNRNDRYTKQFKDMTTKLILKNIHLNQTQHTTITQRAKEALDKDKQLADKHQQKRIKEQHINHKINQLAVHPIIKHVNKKQLPHQLSTDIVDNNDYINKKFRGHTTKKYKQSILILNHLFTNHIHSFKRKNLNQALKQNVGYALGVLKKSNYFKYNHRNHLYKFNTNSIWLCVCKPNKNTTVLTLNLGGKHPKMFRYIIND